VHDALLKRTSAETADTIMEKTVFAETVVNRIVSKIPRETLLKQVRINYGSFENELGNAQLAVPTIPAVAGRAAPAELTVKRITDRLGQASRLTSALDKLHVGLFQSGPDMPLYAEKGSPILERLRQVRTVEDIGEIQAIKNKLLNGTHAIIAWYSSLLGYQTIGQGMGDDRVEALVRRLIQDEIKPAMLKENPRLATHINAFVGSFIKRCKASFKDPCHRVGRDPLRKLQRKERILGSIDLAARRDIPTPMLEFGTALGILYAVRLITPDDEECRQIKALYEQDRSVAAVLTWTGPYHGKVYPGLDAVKDAALINRISAHVARLSDPASEHWQWPLQEFRSDAAA